MERVQSMFGGNVFHTPAGEFVEKATSSSLGAEDWNLNMQVCDTINSYQEGAKDAVKAIKKRLTSNKNYLQTNLTLSLLEGCVKNCGGHFHVLVMTREFCNETLLKVIQPKHNPPVILQQKVLGMIKQWAEAFGSNSSMSGVKYLYEELKEKGVDFPQTASLKGIVESSKVKTHSNPRSHQMSQARSRPNTQTNQSHNVSPNVDQLAKLRKDLNIVNGNAKVFSEMLTELNPVQCDASDYELMKELNRTCRAMQQRIVELIGQVANEEITVELLRVNDDLNNIFLRFDRFEKFRVNQDSTKAPPDVTAPSNIHSDTAVRSSPAIAEPPPSYTDTVQPTPEVNDLIDLTGDSSAVTAPLSQQPVSASSLSKELGDINLNSRSAATPASYPYLSEQLSAFEKPPEEIAQLGSSEKEIEQWLSTDKSDVGMNSQAEPVVHDNGVTDEFSAFLSERATASKNLPDMPSTQGL